VKEIELRKIKEQLEEGTSQNAQDTERGKAIRGEIDELDMQIRQLSTQDGQQISNIARLSKDTATAWKWVQEHQDQFEQEVYGPPLVTCSVTDPRYAAAIESLVRINDVLTITAQTPGDFKKLSDQLYGVMKLGDITLRSCAQSHNRQPCLSAQDMQQMGLDGWAVDHLDGPAPVISMLCGSTKLDRTAVSLQEINDQQYNMLANSQCRSWVTGKQSYAINRRAEYGPGATSTTTKVIRDAQYWTDRPIDTSAKRELEAAKETRTREFDELRAQVKPLRDQLKLLASRREEVTKEIVR
jgi:hypothetical protein